MNTARNPRTGEFMPDTPASHLDAAKDNLGEAKDAIKAGVTEAIDAGAAAAREARLEIDDKLQSLLDKGREMVGQVRRRSGPGADPLDPALQAGERGSHLMGRLPRHRHP